MILSEIVNKVTYRLGTSVTTNFTAEKKKEAINTARKKLILENDIEQFIKETDITVTSGEGSFPSDYLRGVNEFLDRNNKVKELWLTSNEDQIYTKVSITNFDNNVDYTFSIKQGDSSKFVAYPSVTDTLTMRYYYLPDDMTDSIDSGLPSQFDELLILLSARQLLYDNRQYETVGAFDLEISKRMAGFQKARQDSGNRTKSSWNRALNGKKLIF